VPHNETDAQITTNHTILKQGLGTEQDPFIVYRDSSLIERTDLKHLRFVCISDTHNKIDRIHIPNGDVFVHCGDAVHYLTSSRDLVRFNEFVGRLPHRHKIFISGNHCICLNPQRPDLTQAILSNMTYLQDQLIDIEGVKIYGSPWRPRRGWIYPAEAFGYDATRIRHDIWSKVPTDLDFLLTHGPPFSVRDYHPLTDVRIGCPDLLDEVVTRIRPRVHLFGHMHTNRGASLYRSEDNEQLEGASYDPEQHDILFVNLAILQGKTLGQPVVLDYYYLHQA